MLSKFTLSSNTSSKNNISRFTFIKIIIIKANVMKVYSNKITPSLKNVTASESISSRSVTSLENTTLSTFSNVLFVTNQSGTNFDTGRALSTALSHIFWVLHWSGKNPIKREKYQQIHHTFFESYSIQEQIVLQRGSRRVIINSFITLGKNSNVWA